MHLAAGACTPHVINIREHQILIELNGAFFVTFRPRPHICWQSDASVDT